LSHAAITLERITTSGNRTVRARTGPGDQAEASDGTPQGTSRDILDPIFDIRRHI